MIPNLRTAQALQQAQPSASAELIREHMRTRRSALHARRPEALTLASGALDAMRAIAYGHVDEIRSARSLRVMTYELSGQKGLPLEDIAAIALESPLGRRVALAGLRYLVQALEEGEEVGAVASEVASTIEAHARLTAGHARAVADGLLDQHEAAALLPDANELEAQAAKLARAIAIRALPQSASRCPPFYRREQRA